MLSRYFSSVFFPKQPKKKSTTPLNKILRGNSHPKKKLPFKMKFVNDATAAAAAPPRRRCSR